MTDGDQKEPQRAFGFSFGSSRTGIVADEEQRVLGMPLRWFEPVGRDASRSLARLVTAGRALLRRAR